MSGGSSPALIDDIERTPSTASTARPILRSPTFSITTRVGVEGLPLNSRPASTIGTGRSADDGEAEHEVRRARYALDRQRPRRLDDVFERQRAESRVDAAKQRQAAVVVHWCPRLPGRPAPTRVHSGEQSPEQPSYSQIGKLLLQVISAETC